MQLVCKPKVLQLIAGRPVNLLYMTVWEVWLVPDAEELYIPPLKSKPIATMAAATIRALDEFMSVISKTQGSLPALHRNREFRRPTDHSRTSCRC